MHMMDNSIFDGDGVFLNAQVSLGEVVLGFVGVKVGVCGVEVGVYRI